MDSNIQGKWRKHPDFQDTIQTEIIPEKCSSTLDLLKLDAQIRSSNGYSCVNQTDPLAEENHSAQSEEMVQTTAGGVFSPKKKATLEDEATAPQNDISTQEHQQKAPIQERLSLRCPRIFPFRGVVATVLWLILAVGLGWGALTGIVGTQALPGGFVFATVLLVLCCWIGGEVVSLARLPPLFGMLLVGVALRNIPYIDIAKDLKYTSILRNLALTIILTRAGLGMDTTVLQKLGWVCLRLACFPCSFEAIVGGLLAHYLLGMPWLWSFLIGFVLAAISLAVVVPGMIGIQERGYGLDKGIPTLLMASASVDNIICISGFGIMLGIIFSNGSLAMKILQAPLNLLVGLAYGCIMGTIVWFIPSAKQKFPIFLRVCVLLFGGLFAIFKGREVGFTGAAALGCIVFPLVASYGWRKVDQTTDQVVKAYAGLWVVFQPVLFGLIGAEVNLNTLDPVTVGLGIAMLCCGLTIRIIISGLVSFGASLTLKERFYVAFAWMPKATMQAALGPVALDTAINLSAGPEAEALGAKVLTVAVLYILCAAPVGAAAIALLAPKLLHRKQVLELPVTIQDGDIHLTEPAGPGSQP